MATQLFKDGAVVYVDAHDVQNHLNAGWLLEDPNEPKALPAGIEIINQKEPEAVEETPTILESKKRGRKPKSN